MRRADMESAGEIIRRTDVLDKLSEIVFETDPVGNWTYLNKAWTDITGFGVEETLGSNFLDHVHPDEREGTVVLFLRVVSGGAGFCQHETRYRTASGVYRWVEIRASVLRDQAGEITGNAGTIIDITERRAAQELLAEHNRILELVAQDVRLEEILAAIAQTLARYAGQEVSVATLADSDEPILPSDSPPTTLVLERPQGETSTRVGTPTVLAAIGRPDGVVETDFSLSVLHSFVDQFRRKSIAKVPIRATNGGRLLGFLVMPRPALELLEEAQPDLLPRCLDLAAIAIERRQANNDTLHRALHDPLTGLPNRALMEGRIQQALDSARRLKESVGLLIVDLNNFKVVNDTLGHEIGDQLLQHVADRLRESLRQADTVARLGGDEFALVLPGIDGAGDADRVAGKVLRSLREPVDCAGIVINPDASIGVSLFPQHGSDATALLRRADIAMYRVKRRGGGHAFYESYQDEERLSALELAAELDQAIDSDELVLHYQPKVSLSTGEIVGVESLVRWHHPHRGLLLPGRFIPLAENTGLIKRLSLAVLGRALADNEQWRAEGVNITLAVNLSAQLLHDGKLYATLDEFLSSSQLAHGSLELEITESAFMTNPESAIAAITRLDSAGVAFTIDDFGTGYSSLTYLKRLPARSIKIDQSFIRDLATDERDASIVGSAIDLAHNLRMNVIAEGVESAPVDKLLRDLGCDFVQGYLYAAPMPASEFLPWLLREDLRLASS